MAANSDNVENRVLIYMPTGRDALLVCDMLRKLEIEAHPCASFEDFKENLQMGAGAILIAEEALHGGAERYLAEMSESEPVWSDIPIVLFAGNSKNAENLLATIGSRYNATIVERPIRITMLVSAVRGALRARERQYQTRDLLVELKQADQQKDLFLATLSHELRTPLNSILGWIQLMRGNSGEHVDVARAIDVIERNARTQSELIDDILFTSRVITGKLELKFAPISIIPAVQAALDVVRPAASEKNIRLSFGFETKTLDISGDFDRLQQVFWNLLSNAVKFTPEGGRIEILIEDDGKNVSIQISDSGRGIEEEFLPHVFERFRQADNTYSRTAGGLGLGLAIVRHIVEMHNGTVSVTSKGFDKGSVFTVTLPLLQASRKERVEQPVTSPTGSMERSDDRKDDHSYKILLVEDDPDSREMLATNFRLNGFKVMTAESAADALDTLGTFPPDIIVSDVGLPGEDGYSMMRKIRASAAGSSEVPAIALTGYVSTQDQNAAREAGYQEHLPKPVNIDELTRMIYELLNI